MIRKTALVALLTAAACILNSGCALNSKKAVQESGKIDELPSTPPAPPLSGQIREILQNRFKPAGGLPEQVIGDRLIPAPELLAGFYKRRDYRPAWSDDDGVLPRADAFLGAVRKAGLEGLNPRDYGLAEIEAALTGVRRNQDAADLPDARSLAELDLMLTGAMLLYGSHLLNGRVNSVGIDAEWLINHDETDIGGILENALDFGTVEESLKELLPQQPGYAGLRYALALYRDIAAKGGWPAVPPGAKMEKGYLGERVKTLRRRLIASGDMDEGLIVKESLFDEVLDVGVRSFQKRSGLAADGVVGPSTLAALNAPVEERIRQIELNMERWRWLPRDFGERYIKVNIAGFELYVIENDQTLMTMRVVVGKRFWYTPVFSAEMTYLVLNPYWNIPDTILIEDLLPKIQGDPEYLSKNNIKVLQTWGDRGKETDPKTIDWANVKEGSFAYRLRQDPGPINPLGRVKFMFPNEFNVYLHDTPYRAHFARTKRDFSHGCIRVERPVDLAEYVLASDPGWTRKRIRAALGRNATQNVTLPRPIPVYILYFTAWFDPDGTVQFRDDVYGRDRALDEALRGTSLVLR